MACDTGSTAFLASQSKEATTANINTADIDRFLTRLHRSLGTETTFRRDLRSFFAWASARGLSPGNPVEHAATFKTKPGKIGILSPDDASALRMA
jgi:site-specific recombinase XerD